MIHYLSDHPSRLFVLLLAVLSVLSTNVTHATYEGPDYSNLEPVRLEIVQESGPLGARFVNPTKEGIEIEMVEGGGAIIVPWQHMEKFRINKPMTESLNIALSHPDAAERARLLKEEVLPLVPLTSIKPGSTNIHKLVNAYIKANIEAGDWLQAYEMSQLTALDLSPAEIVKNYYTVAEHLFIEGYKDKALNLLDNLVAARPVEESRVQTVNVAQRLSNERLFEPAYRLFVHLADNATGLNRKRLSLRCAYLALELGEGAAVTGHISSALDIEEEDAAILGELELIYGVQAFKQGDSKLALKYLGHALSQAAPDSSLKLVGLYYNYLSYQQLGDLDIAQNILDEMRLLFPDAAYTHSLEKEPKLES
ncbi:hypothetical protein QEH52_02465 [Coraliomargarita sp. SDUM461003]|uniref:Tetratrico peptide repeat group 5 domain-containing protein n=1 Tax=Thalassobacterium maritimum TaxID=3041265 RepID=A0ABU1AQB0_9BACT|nr:hypothetical protein [Coraliomargarita sp. SDUM461003]MDQ8206355.1 hypothetical protein [Coraliomargarita sp. SDUM461003]